MILNEKEKGIIDVFYNIIIKHENLLFCFVYGTKKIECTFDTAYESDNNLDEDDPNYEEYFALCFRNNISNQLFEVNYLNLPDFVYVDDNLIYKKLSTVKNILNENITCLDGLESIKLHSNFDNVVQFLKENKIQYEYELWPNKGCTPEVPWKIIRIQNSVHLFFAKDKLWKIYLENDFKGSLNNGIKIGMKLSDAKKIDKTLEFDDWDEVYISSNFYEVEDNLDDGTIMSICIFIKEMMDDETFFNYEW